MELRHLRYFVTVAERGGFRLAADRLNVAQPAISRQIKDLEAELGFDLFVREGRGVLLTDAGRTYLAHVRRILADLTEAGRSALQVAAGQGGTLSVGLLETASWAGHAPEALNRFARRHPDVALDVRLLSSIAQLAAIEDGDLDGGFVYRQDGMDRPGLASVYLRTDNVVLAASTALVFDHDGDLTVDDIDGLPLVGFPREQSPTYFDRMHQAFDRIGFVPHYVQLAENETMILSLVSAGVGCAFVNSANMARPPKNVQFRAVRDLSLPIDFLFAHRDPPGTLLSLFVDALLV